MTDYTKTKRTTLKRAHERGSYDRDAVHAILDEALICHVGFIHEGAPAVIPTAHWREGETLYIHGSSASRMIRALEDGAPACIEVTMTDGLVLARSGYHSSVNYRTVVVYGAARKITDEADKLAALKAFMEKIVPGRWDELRAPNSREMKATTVLAFPLKEVSAKIRDGGVLDDEEDMNDPVWAGVVPVHRTFGEPEPDAQLRGDIGLPDNLKNYTGPG
ncbi:MAG: pyridoxamine 5'-phosphate oxidase family protein [Alphaproteobacteria bacterium]|nr:pyridoxamine 5'-phosphate oxidase family protein [Alphaproteobacteria bacterium]